MIETSNSVLASEVRNAYLKILEGLTINEHRSVMVSHFGVFSQDLINSIADGIEAQLISSGDDRKTVKRIFSIVIEGLQNIRLHGQNDELERQLAYLFLAKNTENYKVVFGNIILHDDEQILGEYVEKINLFDQNKLKDLYTKILSNGFLSKEGGAGLGLLTMRMKSENMLEYSIEQLPGGRMLFNVQVLISRVK